MFLSAVNILLGRIKLSTGNPPETKSCALKESAKGSDLDLLVIWQTIISSPLRLAATKAGRFLLPDKSVNGKGMITISPFTNWPMPHPLPAYPNLLTVLLHSTAWSLVFVKAYGVLSILQNLLLRQYNLPEASQFPVIKQRDWSSCLPYKESIAWKLTKYQGSGTKARPNGNAKCHAQKFPIRKYFVSEDRHLRLWR
jgi:hypothetical protein